MGKTIAVQINHFMNRNKDSKAVYSIWLEIRFSIAAIGQERLAEQAFAIEV